MDCKCANTLALRFGRHVDAPQAASELFVSVLRVKIGANKTHDNIALKYDSGPRTGGIHVALRYGIRRWNDELFLTWLQGQAVCGHDVSGRKLF